MTETTPARVFSDETRTRRSAAQQARWARVRGMPRMPERGEAGNWRLNTRPWPARIELLGADGAVASFLPLSPLEALKLASKLLSYATDPALFGPAAEAGESEPRCAA